MSWMRASSGFHRVGQALGDVVTVDANGDLLMESGKNILLDGAGMLAHVDNPTTGILLDGNIVSLERSGFEIVGVRSGELRIAAGAALTVKGKTVNTPSSTQSLTGVGSTILANATFVVLSATGNYTLTSTPTIAAGSDGQLLVLTYTGANTLTIQDDGIIASNLRLDGNNNQVMNSGDIIQLIYSSDAGAWVQSGPRQGN